MSTDEFPRHVGAGHAPAAEPGATWIADQIVAKIAAAAARDVDGVEGLRGGRIRRGWVRASDRRRGSAGVRIRHGRAEIDLRLVVRHGVAIPAVVDAVRAQVTERVEFGTGLAVSRVDIGVVDVVAPEPEPPAEAEPAPEAEPAAADAPAVEAPADPA
jgi:uncharacterized alkaline shock family protein YloU